MSLYQNCLCLLAMQQIYFHWHVKYPIPMTLSLISETNHLN